MNFSVPLGMVFGRALLNCNNARFFVTRLLPLTNILHVTAILLFARRIVVWKTLSNF
jgi:hypothetical protein